MGLPASLKNFNVFVDGVSWQGIVETVKQPKLSRKMEEFRGGGMDGPADIDVGQEKIEAELECGGFVREALKSYGISKAAGGLYRFAGAYQSDDTGQVQAVEIVMRGRIKEYDPGDAKVGDKTKTNIKLVLTYYKLTVDGKDLLEIDLLNFIFKVDGDDRLAEQRKAIGLA